MQSFSESKTASFGHQHADVKKGVVYMLRTIYKKEGLKGLWRGADASMMRTGVGSAVQLSTYDYFKNLLISSDWFENNEGHGHIQLHFAASSITSFFVCLFMNPLDVASTRMYNQHSAVDGTAS
jgi:solute carrier family 25, member 34/35